MNKSQREQSPNTTNKREFCSEIIMLPEKANHITVSIEIIPLRQLLKLYQLSMIPISISSYLIKKSTITGIKAGVEVSIQYNQAHLTGIVSSLTYSEAQLQYRLKAKKLLETRY